MDYARRLLRELPRDPEKVLRSRSYADSTFLDLFFEWLDELIYRDPQAGLKWAKVAPELALKTPEENGPEGELAHRSFVAKAWSILAGAYRNCGDHDAAEAAFDEAFEIIGSKPPVSELLKADAERRLSTLRSCQGRASEALDLATGAVVAMRAIPSAPLGGALVAKGYVLFNDFARYAEAIDAFGEALLLAGNIRNSAARKRLHETASKNLAMALSESGKLRNQRTALLFVRQAHKLLRGQVRCPERYRLFWVEGLILCRLGMHAKAEKLFQRAIEGFEALRLPWEIALVGLDLAALLHLCGDYGELEKVAGATFERFRVLSGADRHTLAALSLWMDAVKQRKWIPAEGVEPAVAMREYDGLHAKARRAVLARGRR